VSDQVQFRRLARLQIGGVVIDAPALRIGFRVKKTITSKATDPNAAEIKVYNLAKKTRERLKETADGKTGLSLLAGYAGPAADTDVGALPQIFRGDVRLVLSYREGTENVTEIQAVTGKNLGGNIISTSLSPGATKKERLLAVLDDMKRNNPLVDFSQAFDRVQRGDFKGGLDALKSGASMVGRSLDYTKALARDFGLEAWVDDDQLIISGADEVPKGTLAVLLSPETGLIGAPRPVYDTKNPKAFVVRATGLLNGGFALGRQVKIVSEDLTGVFRIRAVAHTGDTHSGEWSSEVEAVMLSKILYTDGTSDFAPVTPAASQRVGP
jgi:hypothetical protein